MQDRKPTPATEVVCRHDLEGEVTGEEGDTLGVVGPVPDRVTARSQEIRLRGGFVPALGIVMASAAVAAVVLATLLIEVVQGSVPLASASAVAVMLGAAHIDMRERRLPDVWLGGAAFAFIAFAALAPLLGVGAPVDVSGAALGAASMAAPLLALHLLSPDAMGFGDVKAAVVLGAALGALDWRLTIVALLVASLLGAATGLAARQRTIPFGPFLVLGTWVALIAHEPIVTHWLSGGPT